tara:strand:+ start:179 stop:1330 length:1152 start_codon:yes stop_codon:yes gene_type:complete
MPYVGKRPATNVNLDTLFDRKTATPLIINGDMQIAQRTTSGTYTGTEDEVETCDRWKGFIGSAGTFTNTQDTDVPTGNGFAKSWKLDCTTADASLSSTDFFFVRQKLEGQNVQVFKKGTANAETFTLAFWVKSNAIGTYTCELIDADNSRSCSQSYTIVASNTWEKKVLNFPADTTGTFGNDTGASLEVQFWLAAGSGFSSGTLATTWETTTTTDRVASGQVNIASSTDNEWYLTGVQLEVGTFISSTLPDFQFEDFGTALSRCQRYYQHSFPYGTARQNYSSYVAGQSDNSIGATMSSTEFKTVIPFKCEMRAAPTITYYRAQNTPEDSEWTFYDGADKLNPASMASNSQTHRFTAVLTYSSGLTAGNAGLCQGNYSADAEL